MLIESKDLKTPLLEALASARIAEKGIGRHPVANAHIQAKIQALELLVVVIDKLEKGDMPMDKVKSVIKVIDSGIIETLGRNRNASPVTSKILELVEELKQEAKKQPNEGHYRRLDAESIEPSHFTTRVYNLRATGDIPNDIKPKMNVNGKQGLFLVRLTKEQMSMEPKRRTKDVTK